MTPLKIGSAILLSTLIAAPAFLAPAGHAQTTSTPSDTTMVPPTTAAIVPGKQVGEVRVSKIIGETVTDGKNQTIGKVDDLLISGPDKVSMAVLSVGGFLGVGARLVAVPVTELHIGMSESGKAYITLPGATEDSLKAMPDFKYPT